MHRLAFLVGVVMLSLVGLVIVLLIIQHFTNRKPLRETVDAIKAVVTAFKDGAKAGWNSTKQPNAPSGAPAAGKA